MMEKLTEFEELRQAVNKTGINITERIEVKKLEGKGLDTDLSDIYTIPGKELYTVLRDGTIRKVIIHICDISNYKQDWGLPKFHIMECETLEEMRREKRGHRYKKASRNDGQFWIKQRISQGYKKLDICGYCLKQYNKLYNENANKADFNIKRYMTSSITHIEPSITNQRDMTTIPKKYDKNWSKISKDRKECCKWICQKCHFDLSHKEMRFYLHTHHIDADIENNKYENLKVLCIKCHAEEPRHEHIKKTSEYNNFIKIKDRLQHHAG